MGQIISTVIMVLCVIGLSHEHKLLWEELKRIERKMDNDGWDCK